jgi:hypothetical protein
LKETNLKPIIAIVITIIAIATTATTFAVLSSSQNLSSSGSVITSANVSVYSDSACQTNLTTINWGNLSAGANVQRTIYVKNTGTGCSLSLSMTNSNWIPSTASGNMTLTWNQEGKRLNPDQSVAALITLAVSPTIVDITNFSVQISITGTQSGTS